MVLLCPVLDCLLILVEVGEGLKIIVWNIDGSSLLTVDLVTHYTDAEAWADNVWKLDAADEALILGNVVSLSLYLKADLEFDCLSELPLLLVVGVIKDISNSGFQVFLVNARICLIRKDNHKPPRDGSHRSLFNGHFSVANF